MELGHNSRAAENSVETSAKVTRDMRERTQIPWNLVQTACRFTRDWGERGGGEGVRGLGGEELPCKYGESSRVICESSCKHTIEARA